MDKTQKKIYILSFIIPFLLFVLFAVILGLFPFGDKTALFSDNENQFVSFYTFFKNNLLSGDNYFYTFSKNLGGDMTGFFAYYLQNPFLFLLIFAKNENIPAILYYVEALELSLAGLTFQIFLSRAKTDDNTECVSLRYVSLAFSTAYSLMGYVVGYFTLQIYFCDIILLPLVILGLYMIFEQKYRAGSLVYIISLTLSIITNYYIGYMVCIFSLLFALYFLAMSLPIPFRSDTVSVLNTGNVSRQNQRDKPVSDICPGICDKTDIKELVTTIKVFVLSSVSAVFLSLFTLLPTLFSLRGAKEAPGAHTFEFFRTYRVFDSFTEFFTASYDGNVSNVGFPKMYIGIIPLFFVLCFFLNKKIKITERLCTFIFVAVMILSLNIHTFNIIWHGFNEPVGFGYRFTFLLSFLLLFIAYKGFISSANKKTIAAGFAIILAFALYAVFFNRFTQPVMFVALDVVLVFLTTVIFCVANKKVRDYAANIIIFICIFEISVNAVHSLKINLNDASALSDYKSQYERIYNLVEKIKQSDDGFYRTEKDFMYNMQDAMTFDYNGLSHNSSCETESVKKFMGNLGFRNQGIWAFYNQGSTAFADIFLGVKYLISRFDTTDKPYDTKFNIGSDYVFENKHALPPAFFADGKKLGNVDTETQNLFEIQNEIEKCFYFDEDIYEPSQIKNIDYHNLSLKEGKENEYEKIDKNEPAYIEFTVRIKNDNSNLYFYFDAKEKQGGIHVYVNDFDFDDYFTDWRFNIERAGKFKKDDEVSIKLKLDGTDTLLLDDYYLYEEKLDTLIKWSENADALGLKNIALNKISGSHLNGKITLPVDEAMDNDVILSIPYDESWHVSINGRKVDTYKTLDTLLALDLSPFYEESDFAGATINMYYVPKGIITGSAISMLTLITLILVYKDKKHFFK